jgi:hypothetical protein
MEVIATAAAPALPEGGHSPLSVNRSGRLRTSIEEMPALEPKTAAAGATTTLGTGTVGDYLDHLTIVPTTTSPGAVQVQDGAGSVFDLYAGGTVGAALHSWDLPFGSTSKVGGWKVICGANVKVTAVGRFA